MTGLPEIEAKIQSRTRLVSQRKQWRKENKTVVFTNGCFDILHLGHVVYLQQAKKLGDLLIVGLNSDASTERLKGKGRPVVPQQDRAYILASLQAVDYVCIFGEDTPFNLISELVPNVLVKGGDYKIHEIVGREIVEKHQGRVEVIPLVQDRSTTDVIRRIKELVQKGFIK